MSCRTSTISVSETCLLCLPGCMQLALWCAFGRDERRQLTTPRETIEYVHQLLKSNSLTNIDILNSFSCVGKFTSAKRLAKFGKHEFISTSSFPSSSLRELRNNTTEPRTVDQHLLERHGVNNPRTSFRADDDGHKCRASTSNGWAKGTRTR